MSIFSYLRRHVVISTAVGLLVIIVAIIAGRAATQKAPIANTSALKQVTLVEVSNFREGNLAVRANGSVESRSQADLKSQMAAPVSIINAEIGDSVYQGQVLLELENADLRAQLMQAEANLAAAKGQFSTGAISLDSAKQTAIDKIRDAYNKTYDAVVSDAEPILYNNDGSGGQLANFSTEPALTNVILAQDTDLRRDLRSWKSIVDNLSNATSTSAILNAAKFSQNTMTLADSMLNNISRILNNQSLYANQTFASSVATWKATISGARNSVSGAIQGLTAAELGLTTAISSQSGSTNAQVAAAEAGVRNLQAQLAKTIIRTPITGKVSALPLREGELASPGTLLATVVGDDQGIIIQAYVSPTDLSKISTGASVNIIGDTIIKGVVSNVSPSIDPISKKAEVNIDVTGPSTLVIGDNVTVDILPKTNTALSAPKSNTYLLPIQNVKIVPGAAYVLSVDSSSKIEKHDVTLGKIEGDFVEVVAGLNDNMKIVSPVYELDEGQTVKTE